MSSTASPLSSFSFSSSSSAMESFSSGDNSENLKSIQAENVKTIKKTMYCFEYAKGTCPKAEDVCEYGHVYERLFIKFFDFPYKLHPCSKKKSHKPCPGVSTCTYLHEGEFVVIHDNLRALYKPLGNNQYYLARFFAKADRLIHATSLAPLKFSFQKTVVIDPAKFCSKMNIQYLRNVSSAPKKSENHKQPQVTMQTNLVPNFASNAFQSSLSSSASSFVPNSVPNAFPSAFSSTIPNSMQNSLSSTSQQEPVSGQPSYNVQPQYVQYPAAVYNYTHMPVTQTAHSISMQFFSQAGQYPQQMMGPWTYQTVQPYTPNQYDPNWCDPNQYQPNQFDPNPYGT